MFDNLSKAQEIYETDPEGAHSLINKGIDYYETRKEYTWLDTSIAQRQIFIKRRKEQNIQMSGRACIQWKKADNDLNLEICYWYLQLYYSDELDYESAKVYALKRYNIFTKYENFEIPGTDITPL